MAGQYIYSLSLNIYWGLKDVPKWSQQADNIIAYPTITSLLSIHAILKICAAFFHVTQRFPFYKHISCAQ